ncbi:hypothetical protein K492DRAFT_190340 [Lichtheimia hyalospora FSU 10163]|nr:hypothetical protein K492DRAFT_190340 [Lichtheimia hyalospora FSU 10163]
MRLYDRRFVDRVSLRLTAAISMTDLVSAISLVVYTLVGNDGPTCSTVAFLIIWLTNQYIFLSTAIAFNIQWLYLQDRYYNPAFEKWYYIISFLLAIITAVVPLGSNILGYDTAQGVCWYTPSETSTVQLWEYGTYIVPQLACLLYSSVVVLIVIIKLKRDASFQFHEKDPSDDIVSRIVRRILLYPMTPLLTQLGFIVSEIYMFHNKQVSYPLNVWGVSTKGLPGFFNLVGLLVDPAFTSAIQHLKRDLIKRYQHDPHIHRSFSTQSTTSERTWEIYANNGVLDFNLPHAITSTSLAPLAQQKTQQGASNKYLEWIVNHLWPVRMHHNQTTLSNISHTSIQVEKASPQPPAPAATKADNMKQNASYASSIPTLLHSPTAYLIGASESDTMVDDRDMLKDIVLEQPLRSRSTHHPSSSILSAPIFLEDQLDEAVPWRVLEATGDDDMIRNSSTSQHPTQHPTCGTVTTVTSHSISSDQEVDSWLELNDGPPSPSSRMSQWFTRRGDSFEIVRERVARSSKSIRRWCRQQQQLQQSSCTTTMEEQEDYSSSSCEVLTSNDNPSRLSSSSSTDQQQQRSGGSLDLRWSRTLSGSFFDPTALQAVPEESADITRSHETQKRRNS